MVAALVAKVFISIHALHEESDPIAHVPWHVAQFISIHALHEESDLDLDILVAFDFNISIHALHEESDPTRVSVYGFPCQFQSTLSMRRATL